MLKGFMNQMMNNKPSQQIQPKQPQNMRDVMNMVKGKSPQQIEGMAKQLLQQNGGMSQEKISQFEQMAKMFGASDQQISDFKKKL